MILQEIGQANDTPDDIIFDHFQERAFPTRRWGGRYWGGRRSSADSGGTRCFAYLRDHYGARAHGAGGSRTSRS